MPDPISSLQGALQSLPNTGDLKLDGNAKLTNAASRTLTESDALSLTDGGFGDLPGGPVGPAFSEVLRGFLQKVDGAQANAGRLSEQLAAGDPVDVHQVMLALNEASDTMALTLQVRSHVLKAYQELMQLPL